MIRYIAVMVANLLIFAFLGCVSAAPRNPVAPRNPAANDPSQLQTAQTQPASVAVYIGSSAIQYWPAPPTGFDITANTDTDEIARLQEYLRSKITDLGGPLNGAAELRLTSVIARGDRTAVHLAEVIARHRGDQFNYDVPVSGAGLVVMLTQGQIVSISSTLMQPPPFSFVFKQPGFDLSEFTTHEFAVLLENIKTYGKNKAVNDRLQKLAADAGVPFSLKIFLRLSTQAQRDQLSQLLGRLNSFGTARVLVELAMKKRLEFTQRAGHWMLKVIGIFDLPVEFDMEIPEQEGQQLKVRNLREFKQEVVVDVYDGKLFPAGPYPPLQPDATTQVLGDVANYHKRHHQWDGFNGRDESTHAEAIVNITEPHVIDNAAWVQQYLQFWIGTGSQIIHNQDRSYSVLGHEYTHAIVGATSKLVYEGESGAINEHMADIEGSYIDGEHTGQPFTYQIGADVLLPSISGPRQALIALLIQALKVPEESIAKYNLDKVPLRHLRYPILSFTPSIPDVATGVQQYGANCQPSVDNDQCGVHSLSGIPNAAVSAVIDALGADRVHEMIFNTVMLRLTPNSTFKDYVRQLYEECLVTPGLDRTKECPVVIKSFADVGVQYPTDPTPAPAVDPGPPPPRVDATPPPIAGQSQTTPVLDFRGIVTKLPDGTVTIIDHKFDAVILVAKNAKLTAGDFHSVYNFTCASVWGSIAQTQNSKGVWFNYFVQVTKVDGLPDGNCNSLRSSAN